MAKGLFDLPTRAGKSQALTVAKKSKSKATVKNTVKGCSGTVDRIATINAVVEKNLGQYRNEYLVIRDEDTLHTYIDRCIENQYISIDTETDGLDPYTNIIAGICIYTYGQQGAYIPVNHISYVTGMKVQNQLEPSVIINEFNRLLQTRPDIDMFNANFDIRFMRQFGIKYIYCTWDGYLASRLLNENEPQKGLKALHNKYCLDGKGDAFKFDDLFKGIPFTKIPINTGYLYAAHDPVITTELCDYQRQYLGKTPEEAKEGLKDVSWVFHNIEMPCLEAVCSMEDNGIAFDVEYASKLSEKYHAIEQEKLNRFYEALEQYKAKIETYKSKNLNHKLSDPISVTSPSQLATLLYDILNIESPDPKKPRGTGEDILQKIDNPLCRAILDYRGIVKLLSTYIDKLPECVNKKDGRIHCSFNQYGADTGRMSSNSPNLQNIPSRNHDIRKMFKASDGYLLMSSDFSQQEPKCLAALCRKQGDSQMYDTFIEGKDLYSEIASKAFNKPYDECKEFNADGTTNKEGKARRTQAKSILLGTLYGRGEKSIGEQLGCSESKAKAIKESVFRGFPAIRQFEKASIYMAEDKGYVTTVCGRKRRLPEMQLDEYEFQWKDGVAPDNNLLDFDGFDDVSESEVPEDRINYYLNKLSRVWGIHKRKILDEAKDEGIQIIDNGGKIADATRQCVNSRIQGSAADLTKLAMIRLYKNERLKELGFRLLIPVHDEIIAECPKENAKECSKLLSEVMSEAAEEILEMSIRCDVEITERWYGEEVKL